MFINITGQLELPEDLKLKQGVEIRLVYEVDEITHDRKDFGLTIELHGSQSVEEVHRLALGGPLHELPCFHQADWEKMQELMREHKVGTFDAVLGASAAWYARNCTFKLLRTSNDGEDYFEIEACQRCDPQGQQKTNKLYLDEAVPYFEF